MIKSAVLYLRQRGGSLVLALSLALGALGLHAPLSVQAAPAADGSVLYVDNYSDDGAASACTSAPNDCSLRGAINKANKTPGGVTIYLQNGGYNLYGDPHSTEDANVNGDLDIIKDGGSVTIIGDSLNTTTINGRNTDRIFDVQDVGAPTQLTLKNLTLSNGNSGTMSDGGSIRTYGSLTLDTVDISNSYGREGGAIYMRSTYNEKLTLMRTTISHSTSALDGGAIYAYGETTNISNSSFDHNYASGVMGVYFGNDKAGRGGAIYNNSTLSITDSTFAYNNAKVDGGGILNYAFMGANANTYINSSTFNGNGTAVANVSNANGNAATSAVTTIANSILSSSTETENCVNIQDDKGITAFVNGGNNLDSGISCGFANNAGSIFGQDPHLGEFGDYGGPTNTFPLMGGSPAIDHGNPATCAMRDQRGLYAVVKCDMGAFEYNASPIINVAVAAGKGPLPDGSLGYKLQATMMNQMGNPLIGWAVSFEPPDGANIVLSSGTVRTNSLGVAFIYASGSSLLTDALLTVQSGAAEAWFLVNSLGIYPYGHNSGLPNTGFAPEQTTLLPQQPAADVYQDEGQLSLDIPKLGVSLPVVGIPRANDSWDISWLSGQAGYLEGTAFPSWQGNSVLTSHVYLADGSPGPFVHLSSLLWGDRILVHAYGSTYTYEVRTIKAVKPDDTSVLAHRDGAWITLLTCQDYAPSAHVYLKRLAVSAVLIQSSTP